MLLLDLLDHVSQESPEEDQLSQDVLGELQDLLDLVDQEVLGECQVLLLLDRGLDHESLLRDLSDFQRFRLSPPPPYFPSRRPRQSSHEDEELLLLLDVVVDLELLVLVDHEDDQLSFLRSLLGSITLLSSGISTGDSAEAKLPAMMVNKVNSFMLFIHQYCTIMK